MITTERQHQRKPGAAGEWPAGGWENTKAPRSSRKWAEGWNRSEKCPPDPMRRRKGSRTYGRAPEGGWCRGDRWREAWQDSRKVGRLLRRAGYVARHRWPKERAEDRRIGRNILELWRYLEGPAEGQVAADPWKTAREVIACSSSWYKQLRHSPTRLSVVKAPRRCGRRHVCPICAAKTSSSLAASVRAVVQDKSARGELGELALVTLTQRANLEETLAEALDRFRDGWERMTTGRPGARQREIVAGWYMGLEVTRTWKNKGEGAPEPEAEAALGWHVHAHLVIELHQRISTEIGREHIGRAWRRASEAAAKAAALPGFGWDPFAGGCGTSGGRIDWRGRWWRPINPDSPAEVYQACKYPTPLVTLRPVGLAEWLSTAWGRRWHQGGGDFRSVRAQAKALQIEDGPPEITDEETGRIYLAPVLGELAAKCGPNDSPNADGGDPDWNLWRLAWDRVEDLPPQFEYFVDQAGGQIYTKKIPIEGQTAPKTELWLRMPADWADWKMSDTERQLESFARQRDRIRRERRSKPKE